MVFLWVVFVEIFFKVMLYCVFDIFCDFLKGVEDVIDLGFE